MLVLPELVNVKIRELYLDGNVNIARSTSELVAKVRPRARMELAASAFLGGIPRWMTDDLTDDPRGFPCPAFLSAEVFGYALVKNNASVRLYYTLLLKPTCNAFGILNLNYGDSV